MEEKYKKEATNSLLKSLRHWEMAGNVVQRSVRRFDRVTDPILKFSLITQIFSSTLDLGLTIGIYYMDEEVERLDDQSVELMERKNRVITQWEALRDKVENMFDQMMEWIANPTYSPDHPRGNNIMKTAMNDFETGKKEQSAVAASSADSSRLRVPLCAVTEEALAEL